MERRTGEVGEAGPDTATGPDYRLYTPTSVSVATIIGSPLAGAHLMSRNFKRLGNAKLARWTFILCALGWVTILAMGVVASLRFKLDYGSSVNWALAFVFAGAMGGIASGLQGKQVRAHQDAGKLDKGGAAVALLWAGVTIAVVFGLPWALERGVAMTLSVPSASEVVSGDGSTIDVRYEGIDQQQAQAVGQELLSTGLAAPNGMAQVFIVKSKRETVVTFPVQDGTWNNPGIVDAFRDIIRGIAPVLGGFPIRGRLVNTSLEEKAAFTVE